MKTIRNFLVTVFVLLTVLFTNGQTTDDIVTKHVDAVGGKDKLSQVTSVYLETGTEVMGNESASKTTILNGKGYKSESDFNGQQVIQVLNDKGGWAINPFAGASSATALPDDQHKQAEDLIYVTDPLVNYAAHGAKVGLVGQEKVGEVNAFKLKYTNKDNFDIFYYIDPATYNIIQAVKTGNVMGQETTVTTTYSNYQKTDFGISLPYSTNIDMGQFALKINVKKAEVNKVVDPTIFDMPK